MGKYILLLLLLLVVGCVSNVPKSGDWLYTGYEMAAQNESVRRINVSFQEVGGSQLSVPIYLILSELDPLRGSEFKVESDEYEAQFLFVWMRVDGLRVESEFNFNGRSKYIILSNDDSVALTPGKSIRVLVGNDGALSLEMKQPYPSTER